MVGSWQGVSTFLTAFHVSKMKLLSISIFDYERLWNTWTLETEWGNGGHQINNLNVVPSSIAVSTQVDVTWEYGIFLNLRA